MEVTLDQALQKGVEAHKAGNAEEADRYYTAILKADPKHSDANHNMGVLAVGVGKVEAALPFFKTALEVNPNVAQYWLSFIDALIKLDRMADARAVFDQAKSNGARGDGFDRLEKSLVGLEKGSAVNSTEKTQEPPLDQLQGLVNLYTRGQSQEALDQALKLQKQFPRSINLYNMIGSANQSLGKLDEAIEAYREAISIKPDFTEAYYNMGIVFQIDGKLSEAIEAYKKAISIKPDYAEACCNMGNAHRDKGELVEAIEAYKKAISIKPDSVEMYSNIGSVLQKQGKLPEAIEAYKKAISVKPDYAEAYNNMGNVLKDQGKLEEAIKVFNKAISIKPDFADVFNNMGLILKEQGKLDDAIKAFNEAICIKPDFVEIYSNMGVTLRDQGKLEEAIKVFNKAIAVKPDYAEVYNNMGNIFQVQGRLEEAIEAHTKAISIKPDYAEAYWNLYGSSENISEAKKWIAKCLKASPDHLNAKLTLCALKFYEGDSSKFNDVIKSSLKDHPYTRSFAWTFSLPKLPTLHFHRWAFFDHMISLSKKDRPFYEFGVWRGEAFRYLIKTFKKGYGFDTFEGLPEDWHNEKAGTYSSDGNIPKIDGGEFIVGKFEDTLPGFFEENRSMASIINFDADLYSSTICALNHALSVIDKDTILIFDEFIINKNWEQDEYKALEEFCAKNHYTYEVQAISFCTKQVAVKLIGI